MLGIKDVKELYPAIGARVRVLLPNQAWKPGYVGNVLPPAPLVVIFLDDEPGQYHSNTLRMLGVQWEYLRQQAAETAGADPAAVVEPAAAAGEPATEVAMELSAAVAAEPEAAVTAEPAAAVASEPAVVRISEDKKQDVTRRTCRV